MALITDNSPSMCVAGLHCITFCHREAGGSIDVFVEANVKGQEIINTKYFGSWC